MAEVVEDGLKEWQNVVDLFGADDQVPERLELFPGPRVGEMTETRNPGGFRPGTA